MERRGMMAPASPPASGVLTIGGDGDPPISTLTEELLAAALYFVPPIDVLRSALLVSRRFGFASCLAATSRAEDVDNGGDIDEREGGSKGDEGDERVEPPNFWRCHPLLPLPIASEALARPLRYTAHQLQRICLHYAAAADSSAESDSSAYPACLERGSVLPTRMEAASLLQSSPSVGGSRRVCCLATTTDHESKRKSAENLLAGPDNLPRWMRNTCWWSSSPSLSPDSNEQLLFVTRSVDTLMTRVSILPLRDPYRGRWSYTWRETVVRTYRLPAAKAGEEEDDKVLDQGPPCTIRWDAKRTTDGDDGGLDLLRPEWIEFDALLAGHRPVCESPAIPLTPVTGVTEDEASDAWVRFDLPPGAVANVVVVELRGKRNRQSESGGYYTCAERVEVLGVPLYVSAPVPTQGEY